MNRINKIIDRYRIYEELHEVLKEYYVTDRVTPENEMMIMDKIKKVITSYYLYIFEFKTYSSNQIQDKLLINISQMCDITKKVKFNNGKAKIYPVKESDENKERVYRKIMKQMVEYQIENNLSIEEVFKIFENDVANQLSGFKQKLIQNDMELYYGSIYYMVERSLFIINCIKNISNISLNLENMENLMLEYKQKYIDSRDENAKDNDFWNVDDTFYTDYDLIELNYQKLLIIENEFSKVVVQQWKKYLTNPAENSEDYRYVMHCFSSGMVEPNLMKKACCSLYTPTIGNLMYGKSGLIYDIDVDSMDTLCTSDAGSWVINKEEFINRGCPGRWQLTKTDEDTVFYEFPFHSKLITPDVFERECINAINNRNFHYSEIFLNKNARPIGVFYTSECENIDEVKLYAEKYNLPLVEIMVKKQEGKKM